MNICTIIAKNYLAHARVLTESFQKHHPDGRCHVLIIDEVDGYVHADDEAFVLVRPGDIGVEDFDEMRGAYGIMELSTAVKPWLLRYMLEQHDDGSGIAYMDPDIRVVSRMVELETQLREHAVVLTPHVLEGMPRDGKKPSETDILMAGVYNLGFIGLSSRKDAHLVLDWWSERLLTDCHVAPERGLFVDQRWVDFVPGLISDLSIFRHPAYNVAYWNLPERDLEQRDGRYFVSGEPLRFFHFSGYSPARRKLLSTHQDRVDIAGDPALWQICNDYGDALESAGFHEVRTLPYEHDVLPSGVRVISLMRSLYRAAVEEGIGPDSLFTPAGEAEFMAWLAEPSADAPELSRFLYALWADRRDLQRAYPAIPGEDVPGYVGWCMAHGREQVNIPDALMPAEPAALSPAGPAALEAAETYEANRDEAPVVRPLGVNVAGYLRSELGIGEIARQMISALDTAGVLASPVGLVASNSRQGHSYAATGADQQPFPVNLICVNADGLPVFAREAGPAFFDDHYSIGVWWWETSAFPERFHDAFEFVDEIWVGSHFIAETLSKVSPVPVVHIAMPMHFREPPALTAGELVWPDAFTFLFSWDYNSVFARKNPLAVVKAYTDAFAEQDGTALVLKCINSVAEPVGHRLVQDAIAGRSDIVLIDSYLDPADKDRLMRSCDAYVSLHRSEGLGLTMAEAMFHGKPVIATGYSGNTDFMDETNSFLVDYALTPIGRDAGPYPADGEWAEPDVAHATRLLRHVLNNPEDAAARAAKAAADIRERHSLAAAGAAMSRRLEHVAGRVPPSATAPREAPEIVEVQRLLDRGGRPDRRSRFGKVGGAARRTVLRTIRPYTAYQHQVNGALAQALGAVDDAVTTADARAHADVTQAQAAAMAQSRRQQVQIDDHAVAFSRVDVHLASLQAEFERHRAEIDALQAALRSTEERLAATRVEHGGRLDAAEHLTHELRELPYVTGEPFATFDAGAAGEVLGFREGDRRVASGDEAYRAFEDVFRGSENMIADRQRCYLDILERASASPAVDVGCGRGEFLDLLAEAGIDAIGVDQDPGMVARCRDKGHGQTVEGDGIAYLETRDDASLGLVFSAQVAEHLAPEALLGLLSVAARKLRPEGLLVLETVNPHSVAALKAFWVDITHRHPLFPEALLVLARTAGFGSAYVFHPNGTGAVEADRHNCGEYALVARRA